MNLFSLFSRLSVLLLAALLVFSCKKEPVEPNMAVPDFFKSLPTWEAFADNAPEQNPMPTGQAGQTTTETLDVPQIQEDGSIDTLYNVTYTCEQIPYSLTKNPEQIVMYSPDVEILWPGALIQGKSHKNQVGSLLGLVIQERDSINVSIPSLATGDNFRRVKPNQAVVASAIGDMVGSATLNNLATPSSISFKMESYHNEKQMALGMKLSGKYLGFSGSASGNFDQNKSETTVTVQFYQKMYEVVVAPPQTPADFFSEDFTPEKLQQQVSLGRMGPDNLPVYVSNVVYGRMMMFSLTSTASETEIRAMLNLAYNGIGGNVKSSMNLKQKTILEQSKIAITSLGGDAQATLDMIRSGNWKDYFTNTAPLTSAAPLSYTFRNLGDGSIAHIVETDEYSISSCTEKIGVPGVFDFLPPQNLSLSDIGFPVETLTADFNNDGREDMLFNHKNGGLNQFKFGFGTEQGGLALQSVKVNTEMPAESWQNYTTQVADLNGDNLPDLVWNHLGPATNKTYFALNQGDGQFDYYPLVEFQSNGWNKYDLLVGDIDLDGADELLWNITDNCCVNRTWVGELNNAGTTLIRYQPTDFSSVWGAYKAFVGDVNGGGDDLIFNALNSINGLYVGISTGDTSFYLTPYNKRPENGWTPYQAFTGFADNNSNTDMIYNYPSVSINRVYTSLSNGNGTFNMSIGLQDHPVLQDWTPYLTLCGDVDGDGISDLVWVKKKVGVITSDVYTALGSSNGRFDFSPVKQDAPFTETWSQFEVYLADLNGDQKKDLIWINPGVNATLFVATSK